MERTVIDSENAEESSEMTTPIPIEVSSTTAQNLDK